MHFRFKMRNFCYGYVWRPHYSLENRDFWKLPVNDLYEYDVSGSLHKDIEWL